MGERTLAKEELLSQRVDEAVVLAGGASVADKEGFTWGEHASNSCTLMNSS